jgi:hypothetical protein
MGDCFSRGSLCKKKAYNSGYKSSTVLTFSLLCTSDDRLSSHYGKVHSQKSLVDAFREGWMICNDFCLIFYYLQILCLSSWQCKVWVCVRILAGIAGSSPTRSMDVCVVSVVCCEVEVSATGRSLVWSCPVECACLIVISKLQQWGGCRAIQGNKFCIQWDHAAYFCQVPIVRRKWRGRSTFLCRWVVRLGKI